ncbi:MAG: hypothetical protein HY286_15475 [Planctomycetes bacterium]|nr:hypothetical protein [Planctomycetota bacterium]
MIPRSLLILAPLMLASAAAGEDPFETGLKLYKEGKFAEALESFKKAEAESKEGFPELYYNKAVAAYRAGDDHEAEASAERAAAGGGDDYISARDFLRGNIAFRRAENLEKEAEAPPPAGPVPPSLQNGAAAPPAPDPVAIYTRAIGQAEAARDAWIASATKRAASLASAAPGAAERNVERAILKIEELNRKKEEAEKKQKEQKKDDQKKKDDNKKDDKQKPESRPESRPQDGSESRPESKPSQDQDPQKDKQDPRDPKDNPEDQNKDQKNEDKQKPEEQDPNKLTQAQIQKMLDKLDDKEKQRLNLMKAKARVIRVAKDW